MMRAMATTGPPHPIEPEPKDAFPPIWDGPLFRGDKIVDPNPNPPPMYSRRQGGPTSFGYRGRLWLTILLAGINLAGLVLIPPWSGPFGMVYAVIGALMSWVLLRSIWKRERIA
jgi:hypothetical protein